MGARKGGCVESMFGDSKPGYTDHGKRSLEDNSAPFPQFPHVAARTRTPISQPDSSRPLSALHKTAEAITSQVSFPEADIK